MSRSLYAIIHTETNRSAYRTKEHQVEGVTAIQCFDSQGQVQTQHQHQQQPLVRAMSANPIGFVQVMGQAITALGNLTKSYKIYNIYLYL